jgi:hypothetical protein
MRFITTNKAPLRDADTLLSTLINTPVHLEVLAEGGPIGNAELDLLPLATRGGSSVAERLHLCALDDKAPALPESANITIAVSLWRDADASGEELISATPCVGIAECAPEGCIPYEFVSTATAGRCSIITTKVVSMQNAPESLKSGAALSGGFTAHAGFLWPQSGTSCGYSVASADWSDGQLAWLPPKRILLTPEKFEALQNAMTKQLPILAELARCAVFMFG